MIKTSYPSSADYIRDNILNESLDYKVVSRGISNVGRREWVIEWRFAEESEWQAFESFIISLPCTPFPFYDKHDDVNYDVQCISDEIDIGIPLDGYRTVRMTVQSAPFSYTDNRITEASDNRITEASDNRVVQSA